VVGVAQDNSLFKYSIDLGVDITVADPSSAFKLEGEIGHQLGAHQSAIRGVVLSNNDYSMATYSFDSIHVWGIDFNA